MNAVANANGSGVNGCEERTASVEMKVKGGISWWLEPISPDNFSVGQHTAQKAWRWMIREARELDHRKDPLLTDSTGNLQRSLAEIMQWIATTDALSADELRELAGHDNPEVRQAVASNKHCTFSLLAGLCRDHDMTVRIAIAENQHACEEILDFLSTDDIGFVRWQSMYTSWRKRMIAFV